MDSHMPTDLVCRISTGILATSNNRLVLPTNLHRAGFFCRPLSCPRWPRSRSPHPVPTGRGRSRGTGWSGGSGTSAAAWCCRPDTWSPGRQCRGRRRWTGDRCLGCLRDRTGWEGPGGGTGEACLGADPRRSPACPLQTVGEKNYNEIKDTRQNSTSLSSSHYIGEKLK